ncbi:MAG: radical SAM protein [Spirochaetaceae bacterium]|jgi:radical SAM protein with 4Fe4S-binding SPASM domain|nr:radical SAM protein [Spirochaetaceae bacterium]
MEYRPVTCVWEITMGCNMRCGHCGSSCSDPLPDELTTAEAFDAIEQMAEIGLRWVTLSGGEPLTRRDWPQLLRHLTERGVSCNMITNGWNITEDVARQMKENNISTVAISIDGTREIHDRIRKPGSYDRIEQGIRILKQYSITVGAVTTLTKQNIDILPQIKDELIRMGANSWQVQLGLPMGNFTRHEDWLLEPEDVDGILDFCYKTNSEGKIVMYPADCLGYYSHKELRTRQMAFNTPNYQLWDGCNAGIRGFGFLYNGDILGCTSIRDREYIEGNIRERTLRDIWEDKNKFLWRRQMSKDKLSGECSVCKYGSKCLGGCPNTRLTIDHTIYGENRYCVYNVAMKKLKAEITGRSDADALFAEAKEAVQKTEYQQASILLERYLQLKAANAEAWHMKGFADFQNGNYALSEAANAQALSLNPSDSYATKGIGLAVFRQGKMDEGIKLVEKAAQMGDPDAAKELEALKYEQKYGRPYPR